MPRSAAINCYYPSGNAETLTQAFMYNPHFTLTLDTSCACCVTVRCLGKIFCIYVLSVLAHPELVADTLQWPWRIRPPFAFRAASNLESLPGTVGCRTISHDGKRQRCLDLLLVKTIIPLIMGSLWREQDQSVKLDLCCWTALPHKNGLLSFVVT